MTNKQTFNAKLVRLNKLEKLLGDIDYLLLGESKEVKEYYQDLRNKVCSEMRSINTELRNIAKIEKDND